MADPCATKFGLMLQHRKQECLVKELDCLCSRSQSQRRFKMTVNVRMIPSEPHLPRWADISLKMCSPRDKLMNRLTAVYSARVISSPETCSPRDKVMIRLPDVYSAWVFSSPETCSPRDKLMNRLTDVYSTRVYSSPEMCSPRDKLMNRLTDVYSAWV